MLKRFLGVQTLVALILCVGTVAAQSRICPEIVVEALRSLQNNCESLPRNVACYGHISVEADFVDPDVPATFAQPSDVVDLANVRSIRTVPYQEQPLQWGIAVLKVQANIPQALPGQAVTLLLMGDVRIENDPAYADSPMQAIRVSTGFNDPECDLVPPSSLTIQAPQGLTVDFVVNGAQISVSSTAVIRIDQQADQTARLSVTLMDGQAQSSSGTIPFGYTVSAPLDASGSISGALSPAGIVSAAELRTLQRLQLIPDEVMSYPLPLPRQREIAMVAALNDGWLNVLEPRLLRSLIDVLIARGLSPFALEDLSYDDLLNVLDAEIAGDAVGTALARSFAATLRSLEAPLRQAQADPGADSVRVAGLVNDLGYQADFDDDLFDDPIFASMLARIRADRPQVEVLPTPRPAAPTGSFSGGSDDDDDDDDDDD